jgi:DNA polymerase III subunit alpha
MAQPTFIHLRIHSAYSLSEGALQIKKLASLAKDTKMPALAITDTNNLFGALEFSEALSDKGIQPIIGLDLKVDLTPPEQVANKFQQQAGLKRFTSLVLIAQNEQGYLNLMKLSSTAFLEVATYQFG